MKVLKVNFPGGGGGGGLDFSFSFESVPMPVCVCDFRRSCCHRAWSSMPTLHLLQDWALQLVSGHEILCHSPLWWQPGSLLCSRCRLLLQVGSVWPDWLSVNCSVPGMLFSDSETLWQTHSTRHRGLWFFPITFNSNGMCIMHYNTNTVYIIWECNTTVDWLSTQACKVL